MEDEKIIALFWARSEQAIRELDIKYGKLCRKLSNNILHDTQDVEECLNDTYLAAWNTIPPARPDPLRSYVCRIARNYSLKQFYKKTAAKRNCPYEIAMQELEECLCAPDTVESEIETKELTRMIELFLDTLSEENRAIFLRRYWFAESYPEIAKRVGITEKNVSVRLTRIRGQLKKYLLEREVSV